ncbi:DNA ligase 1-like isoform X1 [Cucurbita maxima]|uniref:DNA ligase 1-like isoform X1 n=1 Tax=Cucurbita maxima TaxID=3661 RepID=A0A6J1KGW4_CUCMA|nr:DNA ligase 1-like isoform X1 [Cucurbita maxima]
MSRCFPFPPPGYEKKSRAEDADLLKKEKSKEKKHKKEKKEKEKKEGKEKRDKDKSEEKRREKKDKNKDRDKKKERDKEKEKEKAPHALEDSRSSGKIKSQNGEEVVRIKHNSIQEEKHSGKLDSYVGNKISQNTVLPKETKNSKLVPEVGRRIEDSGTAKVEKLAVAQPKRDDGVATQVARSSEILFEGNKEHIKNKTIDQGKYNGQGIRHDERFSGDSTVPSFTATTTTTANATVESAEKIAEKRKETNDKIRPKEGEAKRGSKHKDKDKEKKGRSNDKATDKEKKKEKKAKEKKEKKAKEKKEKKAKQKEEEEKNAVVDKTKEITKDNLIGRHSTDTNTSQLPDSNIGAAVEENLIKKRKAFEPNGVLHAIDNRSSKLLRPASHPLKENGRILEPCLASPLPPSERQTVEANDVILFSKERKINGIIEAHHPPASLKHKTSEQDDHPQSQPQPQPQLQLQPQPTAIHKKSPHPDSKFLSVVYSVPKMEELSDSDNQDWLFTSNNSQAMKPELEASEAKEMLQVWAEAMQIEPSDVYALPYVIPY